MNIKFANNKNYEYISAYGLENDYYKNIKRQSLEVHMSTSVISYAELDEILSDKANLSSILLTGNVPVDMDGNVIGEAPQNTYEYYDTKGKITIDDDEISFKLFKKSNEEIENEKLKAENEEAIATIDELLIALEV